MGDPQHLDRFSPEQLNAMCKAREIASERRSDLPKEIIASRIIEATSHVGFDVEKLVEQVLRED